MLCELSCTASCMAKQKFAIQSIMACLGYLQMLNNDGPAIASHVSEDSAIVMNHVRHPLPYLS